MKRDGDVTQTRSYLTLLEGILPIDRRTVPLDILAGVTLAALAIPEVMGYTSIARMPVVTGLYTILIPLVIFAILGSSRHLVIGADSATAAILAAGLVGTTAVAGSDEWVAMGAIVAIMAGIWLIVARFARLGFIADFLSSTVLIGFLTGVGIQVSIGQLSAMFGIDGSGVGPIQDVIADLRAISSANVATLFISAGVLAVVIGGKSISKRIPGALIAVLGSIAAGYYLDLESRGVALLGEVHGGLPPLGIPNLALGDIPPLIPISLSVFVVILAQSAATSRAYAKKHGETFSMNSDLAGLGVANLGAGLSGTFMVAGSPTKTQMVDDAGGKTQLAMVTTSLIVLIVLLFLTGPLQYMPVAALASVVFVIGVELIDARAMREIYVERPVEFWVALATAITVIIVGVEQGIILAIILSILAHTRHSYRPRNNLVAKNESGSGSTEAFPLATGKQAAPGLEIYRFTHDMYYANAETLSREVLDLIERSDPPLEWFCIDLTSVTDVDYTAAATLAQLHEELESRGIRLVFTHADDHVHHGLDVSHVTDRTGQDAYFTSTEALLRAYRREHGGGRSPAPGTTD
ncbi:Sulfate permease [hydrothermal vent metagenome]|uniref:Sulfate permease n=1 Tax=hydrothermal vent metagenome TaxID=652676 RepID=A0A3B0SS87_9ZZZZ